MSKETQTVIITTVDERGRRSKTKWQFDLSTSVADIQTAVNSGLPLMDAVTGCGILGAELVIPLVVTPTAATPGTGTNTVMDKSVWRWVDDNGNKSMFQIPAPLAADMSTDDYHINDTQADVIAFIAWVKLNLQSPYGYAITSSIDIVRAWANRKRKNT